jgi:putative membrane protein
MMYGWDSMGGWGWGLMALEAVALWALVVVAGVALWRLALGSSAPGPQERRRTPDDVLAERFACGEIDEDEYRRRTALLDARAGSRS